MDMPDYRPHAAPRARARRSWSVERLVVERRRASESQARPTSKRTEPPREEEALPTWQEAPPRVSVTEPWVLASARSVGEASGRTPGPPPAGPLLTAAVPPLPPVPPPVLTVAEPPEPALPPVEPPPASDDK